MSILRNRLRRRRSEILALAKRHGASHVRLFGSVPRHEERFDSDIDFLVDAGEDVSPFFPAGLILDLQDLLRCRVDVMVASGLHWYIRDRILREAIPL